MEPLSLQTFYADIEAARVANLPVELTSRSLLQSTASLKLSQIRDFAAKGQVGSALDDRHRAAIDIHSQLGSMVPVLDGLSARAIASREFSWIIRRVLWYLALVLLVALLGLLYFRTYIVPEYELLRQDMQLFYHMADFNFDTFPYLALVTVVVAVLLLVNLTLLLTNKTNFLLSCFGGKNYVRSKVASGAAKTVGLLVSQNVPLAEATQNTAMLYALDNVGRREFSRSFGEATVFETYQVLNQYWALRAAKTLERARTLAPISLLALVGGGVAVVYALVVFGPLIGLVSDLVEAGLPS